MTAANADFDRDYIPEPEGGAIRGLLYAFLIMAVLVGIVYAAAAVMA